MYDDVSEELIQVPLFTHGLDWHASTCSSQNSPVHSTYACNYYRLSNMSQIALPPDIIQIMIAQYYFVTINISIIVFIPFA